MIVEDIIIKYLLENGYDGLFNPGAACACDTNDLALKKILVRVNQVTRFHAIVKTLTMTINTHFTSERKSHEIYFKRR